MRFLIVLALAALVVVATARPDNTPKFTAEASHKREQGGHRESVRVQQDGWVSKDGNLRAGGYVQHDREHFGGWRDKNTHGGLYVSGRF